MLFCKWTKIFGLDTFLIVCSSHLVTNAYSTTPFAEWDTTWYMLKQKNRKMWRMLCVFRTSPSPNIPPSYSMKYFKVDPVLLTSLPSPCNFIFGTDPHLWCNLLLNRLPTRRRDAYHEKSVLFISLSMQLHPLLTGNIQKNFHINATSSCCAEDSKVMLGGLNFSCQVSSQLWTS